MSNCCRTPRARYPRWPSRMMEVCASWRRIWWRVLTRTLCIDVNSDTRRLVTTPSWPSSPPTQRRTALNTLRRNVRSLLNKLHQWKRLSIATSKMPPKNWGLLCQPGLYCICTSFYILYLYQILLLLLGSLSGCDLTSLIFLEFLITLVKQITFSRSESLLWFLVWTWMKPTYFIIYLT